MKPAYWPLALNLCGIAFALLYGVGGGSGGETTEGVFMTFWATGWLTIILATSILGRLVLRKEARSRDVALLLIAAVLGFLQTRVVQSDLMALKSLIG